MSAPEPSAWAKKRARELVPLQPEPHRDRDVDDCREGVALALDAAREAGREEIRAAHRHPPQPPTVPKVCDTCGRIRRVFADSPAAQPDAPFECSRCDNGN